MASAPLPPPDEDSTLQMRGVAELDTPAGPASDIENARLFGELRARLFGRDSHLRVGRYRLLRQLGAGAMGEVQLGHDETLDRLVAIKFVHPHLASPRFTAGLEREAKALARLADPNVVHVYEVGIHEGRVYLVMEYIEGCSLRAWIREDKPGWAEVLDAYLDAARGLAAAHGAQVIHRDFKPDNVLRSVEGRVAVVDFGLAALDRDPDGSLSVSWTPGLMGDTDHGYSRSGELKGTPAYMPREQFFGRAGERADQFALCVALYEALWGRRPFPQRTLDTIVEDRADWTPLPPPKSKSKSSQAPPRWLWPILRRGLAPTPEQRWPSVEALIAAIEQGLARARRQRWTAAVGALVLGAGLVSGLGVAYLRPSPTPAADCTKLDGALAGTWGPSERAAVEAVYRAAANDPGQAWLDDSARSVLTSLDRWGERWLASRRALCEAREGGDPALSQRHDECLEHMRQTTSALVALLSRGEPELLREGPEAARALDDPQTCAVRAQTPGPPPPPESSASEVAALRDELAAIEAERALGRYASALTRIELARQSGAALDHPPLTAELTHAHGRLLLDHERGEAGLATLERAADLAVVARHDRIVAESWALMAAYAATRERDLERGRRWLRRAEAASARVGLDARSEARMTSIRGNLELLAHAFTKARDLLEDARDRYLELDEPLLAAHAAADLGRAELELGAEAPAFAALDQSLRLREQVHGPHHPEVGLAAYNLGQLALGFERETMAKALLERALTIWTEADEPRAHDRARAHFVLAQLAIAEAAFEDGLDHAETAALAFEAALEPEAIEHAEAAALIATAHYFLNHPAAASVAYERAVAGYAAAHGPEDLYTALFRVGLGWARLGEGELDRALEAFERGLATIEASGNRSDDAELGLVAHALASGQPAAARARLDQFVAPPEAAMDRFVYELLAGLTELRLGRAQLAGPHLHAALDQARELPEGPMTLAVLLDSVDANELEREACAL